MFRLIISLDRINGQWFVLHNKRRDPDLTRAVRFALGKKSVSTQRKVAPFLQGFFNYQHFSNEPYAAFIREQCDIGRTRIESYLRDLGYTVTDADREDMSVTVTSGTTRCSSCLASSLKALTKVYQWLGANGLRPRANPGKVHNWHLLSPAEKRELAECVHGELKHDNYVGTHFVVTNAPTYPLRMEDPIGLGDRVLEAGRAFGWPDAIYDQVTVMTEDGPRWVDTFDLTAEDWAKASGLGRSLWAPNKGSSGRRTKKIVISEATVEQIRRSFDRVPSRPNFIEILALFEARKWDELRAIPLFPSALGRPYSYHVFNNDYFRPAMAAGGVTIASIANVVRATAHRLRSARIQEECEFIFREGRTQEQITADLANLKDDVAIQSFEAFQRYWGPLQERRSEQAKASRADGRRKRREGKVPAPTPSLPDRPMSRVEHRLAQLR